MTKQQTETLVSKLFIIVFASLLTVIGWMAKSEITSMAQTLRDIRVDVSKLNRQTLLQEQKYKFKFQWVDKEIELLKNHMKAMERKNGN